MTDSSSRVDAPDMRRLAVIAGEAVDEGEVLADTRFRVRGRGETRQDVGALVELAGKRERQRVVVPNADVRRVVLQEVEIDGLRLVVAAELVEGNGAAVLRLGVVRVRAGGLVEIEKRFGGLMEREFDAAEAGHRVVAVAVELERTHVRSLRLLRRVGREKCVTERDARRHRQRIVAREAAVDADRRCRVAAPHRSVREAHLVLDVLLVRQQTSVW